MDLCEIYKTEPAFLRGDWNSAEEAVRVENGQLRSQKEENGLHGYGMKNVREIVEKHEGDLQYITTDTSFLVSVSIYDMK